MKRLSYAVAILIGVMLVYSGCAPSDPNISEARSALSDGDYDRAIESAETALDEDPENLEALEVLADIYVERIRTTDDLEQRTDHFRSLEEVFQRIQEVDPEYADLVRFQYGGLFEDEFMAGVDAFQRGQMEPAAFDSAAAYFENAGILNPEVADTHINQAYALINAGRAREAIEPFERGLEARKEEVRMQEEGEVEVEEGQEVELDPDLYIFLSSLYFEDGRYDDALNILEEGRSTFPDHEEIQEQMLSAYIETGQIERARDEYRTAVETNPDNPTYRYNYGSLLLEAEEYEEAREHLRSATELDPGNPDAYYNLGATYINEAADLNDVIREKDDELRETFDQLSEEEVQQREAELDELVEERTQMFEQAVEPLETARQLAAQRGESDTERNVCSALVVVYAQTGRTEQAEEALECADMDEEELMDPNPGA